MPNQSQATLSPAHREQLLASGISEATITARGYSTVTSKAELSDLGFAPSQQVVPTLLIPIWDYQGQVAQHQVRPDRPRLYRGKPVKYEVPTGSKLVIDVPPTTRDLVLTADSPLFVTEGIKKVDAAASHNLPCFGLLGVNGWTKQNEFWRWVPIGGRTVYVVFDSDIATNPDVQRAAAGLFSYLESRGARPKMILLPANGTAKVGLDDFFAAGNSVDTLLTHATDEAPSFVQAIRSRDLPVYEQHNGGIVRITQTKDGPVRRAVTNFIARIISETVFDNGAEIERELELEAVIHGKQTRVALPAVEFERMAWVIGLLGAEAIIFAGYGVRDEVRAAIQMMSPNIRRFVGIDRLGWHLIDGAAVYIHASGAIYPAAPPRTDSEPENRTLPNPVVDQTLSSHETEGPIFPNKGSQNFRTRIPASLSRYSLPNPSQDLEQLRHDVQASLELLHLATPTIAVPIYCAVWYAAIAEPDFGLHLYGSTGNFKTEFAAIMTQHFGPGLDARHLPANWSSTSNFLRSMMAHAGNVMLPVDDFVPTGSQYDIDRSHRAAEDVFRSQGNAAGRGRCYRDGTPQEPAPPKCLILSTGEVRPSGHSLTSRLLALEVRPGDILDRTDEARRKIFTHAQKQAKEGAFARAMAGFLAWVALHYDRLQEELKEQSTALRAIFADACDHARTADIAGKLIAGLETWLEYAQEIGALTDHQFEKIWHDTQEAMFEVLAAQNGEQADEDPTRRFLSSLQTAFVTGRAYLKYLTPAEDEDGRYGSPTYFGYVKGPSVTPSAESNGTSGEVETDEQPTPGQREFDRTVYLPRGEAVGWKSLGDLYFEPKAALAVVQRLARDAHQPPIPLSPKALGKRLAENGFLAGKSTGRNTLRKNIDGQKVDVFHLRLRDFTELHRCDLDFVDAAHEEAYLEKLANQQQEELLARAKQQRKKDVCAWFQGELQPLLGVENAADPPF